jgi:hypothetical protein
MLKKQQVVIMFGMNPTIRQTPLPLGFSPHPDKYLKRARDV